MKHEEKILLWWVRMIQTCLCMCLRGLHSCWILTVCQVCDFPLSCTARGSHFSFHVTAAHDWSTLLFSVSLHGNWLNACANTAMTKVWTSKATRRDQKDCLNLQTWRTAKATKTRRRKRHRQSCKSRAQRRTHPHCCYMLLPIWIGICGVRNAR